MIAFISQYWKAILGSLVAGLNALYASLDDGVATTQEWVAVLIAIFTVGGTVLFVPNVPRPEPDPESMVHGDHEA